MFEYIRITILFGLSLMPRLSVGGDQEPIISDVETILASAADGDPSSMAASLSSKTHQDVLISMTYFLDHPKALPANWRDEIALGSDDVAKLQILIDCLEIAALDSDSRRIEAARSSAFILSQLFCVLSLESQNSLETMLLNESPVVRSLALRRIDRSNRLTNSVLIGLFADNSVVVRSECIRAMAHRIKQFDDNERPIVLQLMRFSTNDGRDESVLEDSLLSTLCRDTEDRIAQSILMSRILMVVHEEMPIRGLPIQTTPTPGVACLGANAFRILKTMDETAATDTASVVMSETDIRSSKLVSQLAQLIRYNP